MYISKRNFYDGRVIGYGGGYNANDVKGITKGYVLDNIFSQHAYYNRKGSQWFFRVDAERNENLEEILNEN